VNAPRIIEFSVSVLAAFILLVGLSLFSLKPALTEFRTDAGSEWERFLSQVRERNRLLPGLVEAIRGYESGHGKLTEKLLAARAVSNASRDPKRVVRAVNEIETLLKQVEKLFRSRPALGRYPPFAGHWKKVVRLTARLNLTRRSYNKSVSAYNSLLRVFPQSLAAAVFGFVPLDRYPEVPGVSDSCGAVR
jgi:LemA protein